MAEGPLRSHYAGELRAGDSGSRVLLAGWVARHRDHGGVLFVDLRDRSGVVQVVLDPRQVPAAGDLHMEYCITVGGTVRLRPEGTENPALATGAVEVVGDELSILSPADPLPFLIDDRVEADERVRLQYRYLDLRRPSMAAHLRARSEAARAIRDVLSARGFLEVETPTLVRSTPEGARDLLVPSRLQRGRFYALAQSPQLYKQLLMVGGVERYFQIARCYRDEDFRADRQVEFTQLDLEGSFWDEPEVQETVEAVIAEVVERLRGRRPATPFPRLTYAEAMDRYGTDKPDLRFGMEIVDLSPVVAGTGFRVFAEALAAGGSIRGFNAGSRALSRAGMETLVARAKELGARGLVWMEVAADGSVRSPIAKLVEEETRDGVVASLGGAPGDVLLTVADAPLATSRVLGRLRVELGQPRDHEELSFVWITEFPVFEAGEDGSLTPSHHPFTAPADVAQMRADPHKAVARAYDLVVNGVELGSGSVRIHDPKTQAEVFEILGIGQAEAQQRFGWFLEALRFGTPPHAGFAVGFDRLVAVMEQTTSIREVMAFPKTQTGTDPLTASPAIVDEEQLRQLGLALRPETIRALTEGEG